MGMQRHLILFVCVIVSLVSWAQGYNPVADERAIVTSGNMRFTVLTPEMIRIEYSEDKQFEDRASFVVVNRNLPVPRYTSEERDGFLYITTDKLELQYRLDSYPINADRCDPNLQITLDVNGVQEIWYPGKADPYNLKGTTRTLDNADGDVRGWLEDGLLSRSGWAVIDEKAPRWEKGDEYSYNLLFDGKAEENGIGFDWVAQPRKENVIDMYFLGYGHDYKRALSDFTKISGKMPLPPLYVFGYWYSKFQRYTEQEMRELVTEIRSREIPLDVLVIDMDWHRNGKTGDTNGTEWTGWSWNTALFPDPAGFIQWLHEQNLHTTLNLHPADGVFPKEDHYDDLYADLSQRYSTMTADSLVSDDGTIRWNLENQDFYEAFFAHILRPHEAIGVDFWWIDWQQDMIAHNEKNLSNTFWLNHVFFNDKKQQSQNRPFIFHRWGGLGNHRYPIGFSGDSETSFPSLAFQPYFTATASNVGYGYWSHDIGGHIQRGNDNAELYLRWIQYGVFSPILRTHSTASGNIERRIWRYPNFEQMRDAIYLRYAMIPYIYTMARWAYDTGVGLCRPMYYDYPEDDQAYRYEGQYMFGNDMLVAPITTSDNGTGISEKNIWLPDGKWYEVMTGEMLEGGSVVSRLFSREQIPYYYREGAVIPLYPRIMHLNERPDTLIVQLVPGAEGKFDLYEDAGNSADYETAYTFTKITQRTDGGTTVCTIHPREGAFDGMPEERAYRLELLARDVAPKQVLVNGEEVVSEYDAEKRTVLVAIPGQPCSVATTVTVIEGEFE